MNAAILWKEFRQQRSAWIVITLLTFLVLEGLIATAGSARSWQDHLNTRHSILVAITICGVAAYGVVAGALLIASDKEDGTLAFLDDLTGRRAPIWWSKIYAGLLFTLTQGLAVGILTWGRGIAPWPMAALLPVLGLISLAWGILGGALCRHVLSATLVGTVCMAFSWSLTVPLGNALYPFLITELMFSCSAFLVAKQVYCQTDYWRAKETPERFSIGKLLWVLGLVVVLGAGISWAYSLFGGLYDRFLSVLAAVGIGISLTRRQLAGWWLIVLIASATGLAFVAICQFLISPLGQGTVAYLTIETGASLAALLLGLSPLMRGRLVAPHKDRVSFQAILWLVWRQGRWVLVGTTLAAIVIGFSARYSPLLIWPIGSLGIGITCGLAVFCPDQRDGRLWWGTQRLPEGWIWVAKVAFWAALVCGLIGVAYIADRWNFLAADPNALSLPFKDLSTLYTPFDWLHIWNQDRLPEGIRVNLDRTIFLLLGLAYGFAIGTFLGQLARRPVTALVLAIVLAPLAVAFWVPSFLIGGLPLWQVMGIPILLLLASCLVQRAWVADRLLTPRSLSVVVGAALLAILWLAGCLTYRVLEVPDVGEPFDGPAFLATLPSPDNPASALMNRALESLGTTRDVSHFHVQATNLEEALLALAEIQDNNTFSLFGYENDPETQRRRSSFFGPQLDWLFSRPWYLDLQKASAMPPGLVQDIRKDRSPRTSNHIAGRVQLIQNLMNWRMGQLVRNGNLSGALALLDTALGASRQFENDSPAQVYAAGAILESAALGPFLDRWLDAVGSNRPLLESAQAILKKHASERPAAQKAIKVQSLLERDIDPFTTISESVLDTENRRLAVQVPWEKARQQRVFRAMTYGSLLALTRSPAIDRFQTSSQRGDFRGEVAASAGLPPTTGPGWDLTAQKWGSFILQSWPVRECAYWPIVSTALLAERVRLTAQTGIAIRLYQIDHGSIPARVEDLVPAYLPDVPRDPQTGEPVRFDLSETDRWAIPAWIASLPGLGLPAEQSPLGMATAVVRLASRIPFPEGTEGQMAAAGGAPGGPGAPWSVTSLDSAPEEFVPLFPHATIYVGSYARDVPLLPGGVQKK